MTSATKALRVITADNPSPLTGAGTNTLLLGRGRIAVLVNLETESTDAAVVELGKDIAMQIAALNPTYKDKSDVSEEFIEKEKEIRLAQAKEDPKNAKKPDAMAPSTKYFIAASVAVALSRRKATSA